MSKLANLNINFLGKVKYTAIISIVLVAASLFLLSTKWLNLGLDFTGGVTVELQSDKVVDTESIRAILKSNGNGLESAEVLQYGTKNDIQIKLPLSEGNDDMAAKVQDILKTTDYDFVMLGQSLVGPKFGQELIDRGVLALFLALIGIMIYVSIRFQWKLSVGAVAALAHDLIITLGFFALTQIEFNLTVLAALLAILGYSVNDTVVVFDRIRENFRALHNQNEFDIANRSINQTMTRTVITSVTTLLSVIAIAVFGGPILFGFAVALIVGIIIGTYSSIFVASALALKLKLNKDDLTPKTPEEIDEMP